MAVAGEPLRVRPGGALDVIEQTASEHGVKLDPVSLLLGFLIGREWNLLKPVPVPPDPARGEEHAGTLDATQLREWLVTYFQATGRKRRPRKRRPSDAVASDA